MASSEVNAMAHRRRLNADEQAASGASAEVKPPRTGVRGPAIPGDDSRAISQRIALVVSTMERAISQLCDETGFHPESVRRWIRGISPPPAHFLWPFCEATNTSLVWLVTGKGPRESHKLPAYWLSFLGTETIWEALHARLPKDIRGRPIVPGPSSLDEPKHQPSKHDSETSSHDQGVAHAPIQG